VPRPPALLRLALPVLLLAAGGCVSTPLPRFAVPAEAAAHPSAPRNLAVLERVWGLVADLHFDASRDAGEWAATARRFGPAAVAAPDETTLYAVLREMLAPVADSHTRVFTPREVAERRAAVRPRAGFGLLRIEDKWVVSEVVPESPAAAAGVRPGWLVRSRAGKPLGQYPDFRARVGETIEWEFLDAADLPVRLNLTAEALTTAPRREARVLPGGAVVLRFDAFDGPARRWLSARLREHRAAPGLVLDLRHNPGGETLSLGIIVGEFFPEAVDCGTFISRGGRRAAKSSWTWGAARYPGPVAILVGPGTGSAAEIFAAVLQEHGRARVVGTPTPGAVLASHFYALPDGGQLQLSREDYLTPRGRRLEGAGVRPDVEVRPTLAQLRAGEDPALAAAAGLPAAAAP
jgi:carboxyl-terminal processing protease